MKQSYTLLCLLLMAACLAVPSVARGGRGRGGGSFGGLFGGWRSKYGSKSSSSGGGRRVVSGSPVHTAMTVPKLPPLPPPPQPGKTMSMPKPQGASSYPRQQLPPGYNYNYNAAGAAPQGTYYANAQTLPAGATYYAQPPSSMFMGSGTNGFLTGMLAGRLMDSMLFGHHRHHMYRQNQQVDEAGATAGNGRDIIIINNGQQQGEGEGNSQQPLDQNEAFSENPLTTESEEESASVSSEETSNANAADSATATAPPVGGIVCFPIMVNETDPENAELQREVERVVCFPVPTPDPQLASNDCQNNPDCQLEMSTTSTVPPVVAGDIGGAVEGDSAVETSSPVTVVDLDVDATQN